jgi:serine/threonine-protein kinase
MRWVVPGYAEERELGAGASGRVVAAVHVMSGTRVAVKYLSPRLPAAPGFLAAFREEATLLRTIDVPEVVRFYDYAQVPG